MKYECSIYSRQKRAVRRKKVHTWREKVQVSKVNVTNFLNRLKIIIG